MGYFCLGHDILGVQKSLRVELGGGLPLFTEDPRRGLLGNLALGEVKDDDR